MNLSASDLYTLYQPSQCELRLWLRSRGELESEPTEYEKILQELGIRHEREHLQTLGEYTDLTVGSLEERCAKTVEAIRDAQPTLYQPVFSVQMNIKGEECQVLGIPDLLIREGGGYVIRECKSSRHADEVRHYETILQIGLYGLLFEHMAGAPPLRLEVLLGDRTLQEIPYDGGKAAIAHLESALRIKKLSAAFYEPVGWSKCNGCGFFGSCWKSAQDSDDLSRVYGIDQNLARHLHAAGISTTQGLLTKIDEQTLSEIRVFRGSRATRVGLKAKDALLHARVLVDANPMILSKPRLPEGNNLVVFDIEGIPPHLDELEKTYLWGIQVFGEQTGEYLPAASDFGEDGDRRGWTSFLANCTRVLERYGDTPFLHWTSYERTYLRKYAAKYGDPEGVAARLERNLVDLFPITKNAIVLPEPTYSLKVVEKYAGFCRTLDERNGEWAMATYIRAVESGDEDLRRRMMNQIIEYNKEDVLGTWAVFQWLRGL